MRKGVSIGPGVTVLADKSVGENSIIGAGNVVTRDDFPNTIVAGNPARYIYYLSNNILTNFGKNCV